MAGKKTVPVKLVYVIGPGNQISSYDGKTTVYPVHRLTSTQAKKLAVLSTQMASVQSIIQANPGPEGAGIRRTAALLMNKLEARRKALIGPSFATITTSRPYNDYDRLRPVDISKMQRVRPGPRIINRYE